jgi:hypothetical protein
LIQRKPTNRLGYLGPDEIRNHPWLRQFPWEKLYSKDLISSLVPNVIIIFYIIDECG